MKGTSVAGLSVLVLLAIVIGMPSKKQPIIVLEEVEQYAGWRTSIDDSLFITKDTLASFKQFINLGLNSLRKHLSGDTLHTKMYCYCVDTNFHNNIVSIQICTLSIYSLKSPYNNDSLTFFVAQSESQSYGKLVSTLNDSTSTLFEWKGGGQAIGNGQLYFYDVNFDGVLDAVVSNGNVSGSRDFSSFGLFLKTPTGFVTGPKIVSPRLRRNEGRLYEYSDGGVYVLGRRCSHWRGTELVPEWDFGVERERSNPDSIVLRYATRYNWNGDTIFHVLGDAAARYRWDSLIPEYNQRFNGGPGDNFWGELSATSTVQ